MTKATDAQLAQLAARLRPILKPGKPISSTPPTIPLIFPGGLTADEVEQVRRGWLPANLRGARLHHYHAIKPAR